MNSCNLVTKTTIFTPTALMIVKKLGSKSLRLQVDLFHLQLLKGSLTRHITELLPYIGKYKYYLFKICIIPFSSWRTFSYGILNEILGHIQISQVPGRNEPDSDGEINYQYILQLLEEKKYDGYIGLEYRPKTSTKTSTEWISKWGYSF